MLNVKIISRTLRYPHQSEKAVDSTAIKLKTTQMAIKLPKKMCVVKCPERSRNFSCTYREGLTIKIEISRGSWSGSDILSLQLLSIPRLLSFQTLSINCVIQMRHFAHPNALVLLFDDNQLLVSLLPSFIHTSKLNANLICLRKLPQESLSNCV